MRANLRNLRPLRVDPDHPDRWWTRFVFWHCVLVLVWISLGLFLTSDINHRYTANPPPPPKPGQPRRHPESSLGVLHRHIPIPWWAWALLFALLAAGLLWHRTRPVCYFVAAMLAAAFTLFTVEFTYFSGNSTNQITVPLATLAPDALIAGYRYSRLPGTPRRGLR